MFLHYLLLHVASTYVPLPFWWFSSLVILLMFPGGGRETLHCKGAPWPSKLLVHLGFALLLVLFHIFFEAFQSVFVFCFKIWPLLFCCSFKHFLLGTFLGGDLCFWHFGR